MSSNNIQVINRVVVLREEVDHLLVDRERVVSKIHQVKGTLKERAYGKWDVVMAIAALVGLTVLIIGILARLHANQLLNIPFFNGLSNKMIDACLVGGSFAFCVYGLLMIIWKYHRNADQKILKDVDKHLTDLEQLDELHETVATQEQIVHLPSTTQNLLQDHLLIFAP